MSLSPIAFAESLRIGTIDFVSPDEIKVLLELDAPDSVALNTGRPSAFPRINGYVLIPCDEGHLVGQVEWITIERSQYPKRKGMQDFGLIDLPYPLRKMKLNPLGCLRYGEDDAGRESYQFQRGVEAYPTVGDPVLLPTDKQLRAIVESGKNRYVKIGTSPLAANAEVSIDPDRLFGRHLAVLGNTGSGKSCSVAGLIRWSLEAAGEAAKKTAKKREEGPEEVKPNARFIILDPNGEYANAFQGLGKVRRFAVKVDEKAQNSSEQSEEDPKQLQVPLWLWNSEEWCAFARARDGAQRPILRRALREMRLGGATIENDTLDVRRRVSSMLISLKACEHSGESYQGWRFGPLVAAFKEDLAAYVNKYPDYATDLKMLHEDICSLLSRKGQSRTKPDGSVWYEAFPAAAVGCVVSNFESFLDSIGGIVYQLGPGEDAPIPFDGTKFADHLDTLARADGKPQYFDYLIMRIRMLLGDANVASMATNPQSLSLAEWLDEYIGNDDESNGSIAVINLSLVPSEVIHIVTAVIARMTLEALQRYRKLVDVKGLPTVLVMEEAHTFIKRYKDDSELANAATICCQVFEKIAREGRKFGLGLVLSSQRPSELSPTVLSQCNTFLLHRISNDKDQEVIGKLVPDNLRGLLRDLPTLPARKAILLGWASELPTLVHMNELPKDQRPQSEDPDFWKVWSREKRRTVNWKKIADDWQQYGDAKGAGQGGHQRSPSGVTPLAGTAEGEADEGTGSGGA